MTITPEEVAALHLKAMQGDIMPFLQRANDMAALIARMDEALKAADEVMRRIGPVGISKECNDALRAYRTARGQE